MTGGFHPGEPVPASTPHAPIVYFTSRGKTP